MSDHQCAGSSESSSTSSRSGPAAQLIIVGWSGSEFQTGNSSITLPAHYSNDPVKYDVIDCFKNTSWEFIADILMDDFR